ncbi:MAG: hypothetical protein C5B49_07555 [Bdellovibrio sp.]|nr:MAG: hypothetical protein C5B49_07555 [Bdellovibrio sp.]
MSDPNDELSELLKPLRGLSPDDVEMKVWQLAVQSEARAGRKTTTTTRSQWAWQLAAAMFVGFVLGAILIKNFFPTIVQDPLAATISVGDATFEHSHANLD